MKGRKNDLEGRAMDAEADKGGLKLLPRPQRAGHHHALKGQGIERQRIFLRP